MNANLPAVRSQYFKLVDELAALAYLVRGAALHPRWVEESDLSHLTPVVGEVTTIVTDLTTTSEADLNAIHGQLSFHLNDELLSGLLAFYSGLVRRDRPRVVEAIRMIDRYIRWHMQHAAELTPAATAWAPTPDVLRVMAGALTAREVAGIRMALDAQQAQSAGQN